MRIFVLGSVSAALVVVVALLALAIPKSAGLVDVTFDTTQGLLILDVQLFDGVEPELQPVAGVRIDGDIITAIYRDDIPEAEDAAVVIDGEGRVLMPALIDFHVHFGIADGAPPWATSATELPSLARQHETTLYAGITSVVAGSTNPLASFSRPPVLSPRVYAASRSVIAAEGHPGPMIREIVPWPFSEWTLNGLLFEAGPSGIVDAELQEAIQDGSHHVKIIFDDAIPWNSPRLTPEDVRLAIEIAHRNNKPAYVHVGDPEEAVVAAQAGADVLMHTPFAEAFTESQLEALVATGVPVVSTSQIWLWFARGMDKTPAFTPLETFLMAPHVRESFDVSWEETIRDYPAGAFGKSYMARIPGFDRQINSNVVAMHRAGVTILAGTDTGVPALTHGASLVYELERLQGLGLEPFEVLRSATSVPGGLLTEDDTVLGVIAPGARAELLLLQGNPLDDVRVLQHLDLVITQGKVLRRTPPLVRTP